MPTASTRFQGPVGKQHLFMLLTAVFVLLGFCEIATRRLVMKASAIERRTDRELDAARLANGPRSMLFVGNSLLVDALPEGATRDVAPTGWLLRRLVVEQTSFLDWKYALRAIKRRGTHPQVIAVMLSPEQLVSNAARADYSAMRLLDRADIIPMGVEAGLHPTDISRMVLSHDSRLYGFRSESRKVLLGLIIPGMSGLVERLRPNAVEKADTIAMFRIARDRLKELRESVEAGGSRLLLVQAPALKVHGAKSRAVSHAAEDVGVLIFTPNPPGGYDPVDFKDGFHVSASGAGKFTTELRSTLQQLLADTSGLERGYSARR